MKKLRNLFKRKSNAPVVENKFTPHKACWEGCQFWNRINFELYAEIKRTRKSI